MRHLELWLGGVLLLHIIRGLEDAELSQFGANVDKSEYIDPASL